MTQYLFLDEFTENDGGLTSLIGMKMKENNFKARMGKRRRKLSGAKFSPPSYSRVATCELGPKSEENAGRAAYRCEQIALEKGKHLPPALFFDSSSLTTSRASEAP